MMNDEYDNYCHYFLGNYDIDDDGDGDICFKDNFVG